MSNINIWFEKNIKILIIKLNLWIDSLQRSKNIPGWNIFRVYGRMRNPRRLRRDHQYGCGSDEDIAEIDLRDAVSYRARPGRDGRCGESAAIERAIVRAIPEGEEGNVALLGRKIEARCRHTQ